jgi:hypothetical protein
MSLSRTDMLAYLVAEHAQTASLVAGFVEDDEATGYQYVLDKAEEVLASESRLAAQYAVLDYFALETFSKKLAKKRNVDISGDGGLKGGKYIPRDQLREDLALAARQAARYGYTNLSETDEPADMVAGRLNFDFLAPRSNW